MVSFEEFQDMIEEIVQTFPGGVLPGAERRSFFARKHPEIPPGRRWP